MTLHDEWRILRARGVNLPWEVFRDNAEIYRNLSKKGRERNGHVRDWQTTLEFDHLHGKVLSKSQQAPPEQKKPKSSGDKFFGQNEEGNK